MTTTARQATVATVWDADTATILDGCASADLVAASRDAGDTGIVRAEQHTDGLWYPSDGDAATRVYIEADDLDADDED